MNNGKNYSVLDALTILSTVLQLENYEAEMKAAGNDDLMEELQRQDREYLDKIIQNQEQILKNQQLIISRLERKALDI